MNVCDVPTPVSMTMSVLMVPTIIAHVQVTNNFIVCNYAADGGCLDNDDGSSYYSIRSNFCVYGKRVPLPVCSAPLRRGPGTAEAFVCPDILCSGRRAQAKL